MRLTSGTRIAAYVVASPLGAGAMGEVYRARDTRLDRDVALKVLPEAFTADPDRLARFEREARVLASLNHPNIAQIHGIEEADATRALVLELVEGPTLDDRLEQGPLPLDDVLSIAHQIALALQAAHEAHVVHRDLKPANVKVCEDGTVKVLDFGLAKGLDTAAPPDAGPLQSATLTASMTRMDARMVVGTPAYMAPEQAEGLPTDTRGDLWSFGVVLYEMLTGERLFGGDTVAQVLARVIDRDLDLSTLPRATPEPLRRLLRRCLERDPRRRMRDVGEAITDLEAAATPPDAPAPAAGEAPALRSPVQRWRARIAVALASLTLGCLAGVATFWTFAPTLEPAAVRRLTLDLPFPLARGSTFALSPDGSVLAYVGRTSAAGPRQLLIRRLDQADAQPLAGTGGALDPFFSPDGTWIGFFAPSGSESTERLQPRWMLSRVPVAGGAPVTLAGNVLALGGSWGDDDRIVIGGMGGLLRVPAGGGTPEAVLKAGTVPELAICSSPNVLPGARALLYTEALTSGERHLKAVPLPGAEPRVVATNVAAATYTPTGHLVFQSAAPLTPGVPASGAATLMAAPFDADSLELVGEPVSVVPGAATAAWTADGALVYTTEVWNRSETLRTLAWMDREGREESLAAPPRAYGGPRISPDGSRIAVDVTAANGSADILIYDLARQASNRLTFEGWNVSPLWSPDGRRVVFTSARPDGFGLFQKAADGTGQAEPLTATNRTMRVAGAWESPDALVVGQDADLHLLSLDGGRALRPLLATEFRDAFPAVSPDGRWIAYQSNETGRPAVFVRPFPNVEDGKWQVSQGSGFSPAWSRDGRELFYITANPTGRAMMAVEYAGGPAFAPSRPASVFALPAHVALGGASRQWDVTSDGRRFLMIREEEVGAGHDSREGPTELVYVGNWLTALTEQVQR